jgi:hypothetical protein
VLAPASLAKLESIPNLGGALELLSAAKEMRKSEQSSRQRANDKVRG